MDELHKMDVDNWSVVNTEVPRCMYVHLCTYVEYNIVLFCFSVGLRYIRSYLIDCGGSISGDRYFLAELPSCARTFCGDRNDARCCDRAFH